MSLPFAVLLLFWFMGCFVLRACVPLAYLLRAVL